jgi:hypothetical protein
MYYVNQFLSLYFLQIKIWYTTIFFLDLKRKEKEKKSRDQNLLKKYKISKRDGD